MNNFFDKIYIINLEKDSDRLEYMKKQCDKYNINFQRSIAVNGKNIQKTVKKLRKNQLGCAMSHLNIYKEIVQLNLDKVLILEDDVTLTQWIIKLPSIMEDVPNDWDVVWVGNSRRKWPRNTCSLVSDPPYNFDKMEKITPHIYKFNCGYNNNCPMGTYAYAVSNKGAKKILANYNFDVPIDYLVNYKELNKYLLTPSIIIHCYDFGSNIASSSKNRENSYEYIWELNPKYENMIFYLLENMHNILEKNNIRYMAMFGTLLGCVRHQGLIPWDDDVDIVVHTDDMENLKKALKQLELNFPDITYIPTISSGCRKLKYKIFSRNGKEIKGHQHTWPFIDIFMYNLVEDTIIIDRCNYQQHIKIKNPSDFLITSQQFNSNSGHISIPINVPKNSKLILDSLYGNDWEDSCHSGDYNHRLERRKKAYKSKCTQVNMSHNINLPIKYNKKIWLLFTVTEITDLDSILETLNDNNIGGIFSFDTIYTKENPNIISKITNVGHNIITTQEELKLNFNFFQTINTTNMLDFKINQDVEILKLEDILDENIKLIIQNINKHGYSFYNIGSKISKDLYKSTKKLKKKNINYTLILGVFIVLILILFVILYE
jgi:glycosyl transferase family 25